MLKDEMIAKGAKYIQSIYLLYTANGKMLINNTFRDSEENLL